jgi:hypothetical protein
MNAHPVQASDGEDFDEDDPEKEAGQAFFDNAARTRRSGAV